MVLATQQPGQIHRDVLTQSDIVFAHRVTSKADIEALNEIMQTYLLASIRQQIDDLPALKGSAIILDDNSERIYPLRMRPRMTWHGGESRSQSAPKWNSNPENLKERKLNINMVKFKSHLQKSNYPYFFEEIN
jgi:hypothetical protein